MLITNEVHVHHIRELMLSMRDAHGDLPELISYQFGAGEAAEASAHEVEHALRKGGWRAVIRSVDTSTGIVWVRFYTNGVLPEL